MLKDAMRCGLCGAVCPGEETCAERFGRCLALEYEYPAVFGAVHHLTVLCYMLQHNGYSHEAWFAAREMLAQFLRGEVTPAGMRQRIQGRFGRVNHKQSITRGSKMAAFDSIAWTRTMADIRLDNPDDYCADVKRWAAGVLADTRMVVNQEQE